MTLERVRVRDCACPDTPHAEEGDAIFLSPTLPALGGIVAEQQMTKATDQEQLVQDWLVTFVRYGAKDWNLPEPFDVEAILADYALFRPVALRAADLYQEAVTAPLAPRRSKPSATGRTTATTSRRRAPTPSLSE
jgi:hypothetical protein